MANEEISLDTVFSGFNKGTDLQPKNTRANNQGVKINDIAGFIKFDTRDTAGAPTSGKVGDMVFNPKDGLLYICKSIGPLVFVSVQLD